VFFSVQQRTSSRYILIETCSRRERRLNGLWQRTDMYDAGVAPPKPTRGRVQATPPRVVGQWLLDGGKLRLAAPGARLVAAAAAPSKLRLASLFDAVAHFVLPHLGLRELLACAAVRRAWRDASRAPVLWRRLVIPPALQPRLTPEAFARLIALAEGQLETLEAPNCRLLGDAAVAQLRQQPLLHTVSLAGCTLLGGETLREALPPSVRTLRVDGVRVSADDWRALTASGIALDVTPCGRGGCSLCGAERYTCAFGNCSEAGFRFCMLRLCGQDVAFCRLCSVRRGPWVDDLIMPCSGGCGSVISPHFSRLLSIYQPGRVPVKCRFFKRCGARYGALCAKTSLTYVSCDWEEGDELRPYCAPCLAAHTTRCGACGERACLCCNKEPCWGCGHKLCAACAENHVSYCEAHQQCVHLLPDVLRARPGICTLPKCRGCERCPLAAPGRGLHVCARNNETRQAIANQARWTDDRSNPGCRSCLSEPICGACGVLCDACGVLRCLRCIEDNSEPCCPKEE